MSERSFCIFRKIHVQSTWATQVAYECFFSPPLVTKTDTWIRTLVNVGWTALIESCDIATKRKLARVVLVRIQVPVLDASKWRAIAGADSHGYSESGSETC